jgi:exodeoxyribonuclease VII large subunit
MATVAAVENRWSRAGHRALETRMQRVDGLSRRLVHPAAAVRQQRRETATLGGRLARALAQTMSGSRAAVGHAGRRLAWQLRQPLKQHARLAATHATFLRSGRVQIEAAGARVGALARSLAHLDPRAVLERGYSIVTTAEGAVVQDAARLTVGDRITLTLARGSAGAKVENVEPSAPK